MGPYCKFCGRRCFVHLPGETPQEAIEAYKTKAVLGIIATCSAGQAFEREKTGWCYDRIRTEMRDQKARAMVERAFPSEI